MLQKQSERQGKCKVDYDFTEEQLGLYRHSATVLCRAIAVLEEAKLREKIAMLAAIISDEKLRTYVT